MVTGERVRTDTQSRLAVVAIGVTVVLWASAFVAIRHVIPEVSAGALALGRLIVGSVVLGVLVLARRGREESQGWPASNGWMLLVACGLIWFGAYNVALNLAERRVDAGTAAMLVHIAPLLIAVLAGLLLKEGFPSRVLVGCVVAFSGVLMIGYAQAPQGRRDDLVGVLLCVVAAIAYAVGVITQKPLLGSMSALRVTWLACTIGAIGCLPFAGDLMRDLAAASPATVGWVIYLGVGPTALAFTTWAYALARTSAGKLGTTTYLVPPVAVVLGWLLLGETPALLALLGGGICLLGVYLARRTG